MQASSTTALEKRKHHAEPNLLQPRGRNDRTAQPFTGRFVGCPCGWGGIGAIVALLFAEQRGEEVRGQLSDQSESTFRRVRDGVEHIAKDVQKTVEHARG